MNTLTTRPILVVGGGIAGLTAALEAAEAGAEVILVERAPALGGRVLRSHSYFPKLCPPSCGMEVNFQRLERNPRIRVLADTEVTAAEREGEVWKVTLSSNPAYVNSRCTLCDDCAQVCPASIPDAFNLGMGETTAIRLANPEAVPRRYHIERSACPEGCTKCVEACQVDAIDLGAEGVEETVEVGSVVLATGWNPYPKDKLVELGGDRFPNVIANVEMERLAAPAGPTGGKIQRPSDGEAPKKIAFVQCAGSRDVNHLSYCSAICCLASFKQAHYVHEQLPEAEVTIFYIDRRAPGRNERMLTQVDELESVTLIKGKVGVIDEKPDKSLTLRVEDIESGRLLEAEADLVVLATGMQSTLGDSLPFPVELDPDGFGLDDDINGIYVAGVARRPEDVAASTRDATGTAARAAVAAGR